MHAIRVAGLSAVAVLLSVLAACGGGGDGEAADSTDTSQPGLGPDTGAVGQFVAACSGTGCGAVDSQTYGGSGIGVWRYANVGTGNATVPVSIDGVAGKSVTLVFTNTGDTEVAIPSIRLDAAQTAARSVARAEAPVPRFNRVPAVVRDFDVRAALEAASTGAASRPSARVAPAAAVAVGAHREWNDYGGTARATTLLAQRAAGDGRMVNLWVADAEYQPGKITAAMVDDLASRFTAGDSAVYPMVTGLAGQPWGPYDAGPRLIGPEQDINIVLLNLQPDGAAYGTIGYFFSLNNFLNEGNNLGQTSAEALAIFLDTETLYLGGQSGFDLGVSTLAHEFLHMVNFYQRGVLLSAGHAAQYYVNETWLEEMTALMMEDIVRTRLGQSRPAADTELGQWLRANPNCGFIRQWNPDPDSDCFSYDHASAFGSFLLRQFGLGFYRSLLRDTYSTWSEAVLDHAIRQAGGDGLHGALRRWGANLALLPASGLPGGYGYPQREEDGYVLRGYDGTAMQSVRVLPDHVPASLEPDAHFPVLRSVSGARYTESVTVPPATTLSVVVR
ncbi:hypothetical protein GCM10023144_41150 [Pigmentiphaga soli]|uniref:Hemagglutinin n=1 Tax=Pigmentiphaga soli TaxID=1007095 RepID=A0ABP8HLG9_9BURK